MQKYDYNKIIGYSSILYGESGCGKTTLIKDIINCVQTKIPNICIICPTQDQNKTYTGIVPDEFITSHDITPQQFINKVHKIIQRQQFVSELYAQIQEINVLEPIINIITSNNIISKQDKDYIQYTKFAEHIKNMNNYLADESNKDEPDDTQTRNQFITKLQQLQNGKIKLVQNIIMQNQSLIIDQYTHLFDKYQMSVIEHIQINPHLLLIIDDCASILSKTLQNEDTIKKIFFQGRHYNLTVLLTVQTQNTIQPDLRKQAFFSFFGTPTSFEQYAKNNLNKQPAELRIIMNKFKDANGGKAIMVYDRMNCNFIVFQPSLHNTFSYYNNSIWDYCRYIQNQ